MMHGQKSIKSYFCLKFYIPVLKPQKGSPIYIYVDGEPLCTLCVLLCYIVSPQLASTSYKHLFLGTFIIHMNGMARWLKGNVGRVF